MDLIEKAVWHVESHLRAPATLEEIAGACGVSPAYLTRAFASVTGQSLMRYARARRLSEAARILALGVPDILGLALDIGYGSHEAFTRAFRGHFGVTPETVRDRRSHQSLTLTEPLIMDQPLAKPLSAPTIKPHPALRLAGLVELFPVDKIATIPALWEQFNATCDGLGGVVGEAAWGVSLSFSEERGCDYMCAFEVDAAPDLPQGYEIRTIAAATYAVFEQPGSIALMRPTIHAAWNWLPGSGYRPAEAPMLEYYGREFDPVSGEGGFSIWLPVIREG